MKKSIIVTAIVSLIVGALLVVVGYFVYVVVNMRAEVAQNTQVLGQVVNFLNQNIQAQQVAAPVATPAKAK